MTNDDILSAEHGGALVCQKGAFLAANHTVGVEMEMAKTFKAGFFGEERKGRDTHTHTHTHTELIRQTDCLESFTLPPYIDTGLKNLNR